MDPYRQALCTAAPYPGALDQPKLTLHDTKMFVLLWCMDLLENDRCLLYFAFGVAQFIMSGLLGHHVTNTFVFNVVEMLCMALLSGMAELVGALCRICARSANSNKTAKKQKHKNKSRRLGRNI